MSTVISDRTPSQIASEINFIKEQSGKMLLINAVAIGQRLTEAKELVPHGEWIKWLSESVSYSRSTAARLMKTFREYGPKLLTSPDRESNPNVAALQHLGYFQGLLLFGIPVDEREQFIEDNDVETMSARELQQAVDERSRAPEENGQLSQLAAQVQEPENQAAPKQKEPEEAADEVSDGAMDGATELVPVIRRTSKPKNVQTMRPSASINAANTCATNINAANTGAVNTYAANTNSEIAKYEEQFDLHRANLVSAYGELLNILVALDRIDKVKKEAKREEALEVANKW